MAGRCDEPVGCGADAGDRAGNSNGFQGRYPSSFLVFCMGHFCGGVTLGAFAAFSTWKDSIAVGLGFAALAVLTATTGAKLLARVPYRVQQCDSSLTIFPVMGAAAVVLDSVYSVRNAYLWPLTGWYIRWDKVTYRAMGVEDCFFVCHLLSGYPVLKETLRRATQVTSSVIES